jgi:hypothetical protein
MENTFNSLVMNCVEYNDVARLNDIMRAHGAHVSFESEPLRNALALAKARSCTKLVAALYEHGAGSFPPHKNEPLMGEAAYVRAMERAVVSEDTTRLEEMHSVYAMKFRSLDTLTEGGMTLLGTAVLANKPGAFRWLIKAGAHIDVVDKWGKTAFKYADLYKSQRILAMVREIAVTLDSGAISPEQEDVYRMVEALTRPEADAYVRTAALMGKEKAERIFKHESWKGLPVHEWASVGSMIVVALSPDLAVGHSAFRVGLLHKPIDCES